MATFLANGGDRKAIKTMFSKAMVSCKEVIIVAAWVE